VRGFSFVGAPSMVRMSSGSFIFLFLLLGRLTFSFSIGHTSVEQATTNTGTLHCVQDDDFGSG
jgi:hypothetical protein